MLDEPISRMSPRIKARWVRALRSGKFKQTRGRLRFTAAEREQELLEREVGDHPLPKVGYCCLGVLHKLVTRQEPEVGQRILDQDVCIDCGLEVRVEDILSTLNDKGPSIVNGFRVNGKPLSFKKIATWIEKNL